MFETRPVEYAISKDKGRFHPASGTAGLQRPSLVALGARSLKRLREATQRSPPVLQQSNGSLLDSSW